jgi:hypothetical protein
LRPVCSGSRLPLPEAGLATDAGPGAAEDAGPGAGAGLSPDGEPGGAAVTAEPPEASAGGCGRVATGSSGSSMGKSGSSSSVGRDAASI